MRNCASNARRVSEDKSVIRAMNKAVAGNARENLARRRSQRDSVVVREGTAFICAAIIHALRVGRIGVGTESLKSVA